MKRIGYRIFQFFFYKASHFLKWRTPLLLDGAGSLLKLPDVVKSKGIRKVLIVTDKEIMALHLCDSLLNALDTEGIQCIVFDNVRANPTIDMIEEARNVYIANNCQGFIAFGGGSVIDTAKAAGARIARPKKTIAQMGGFLKVRKELPPLFAVPTTAGTGSEVTIAAVITDRATHHKYAVNDPQMIPICAVLDPEIITGLPPSITAATGMDALTHAVEAYITWGVSKRCKRLSEDAVRLIFANIWETYRTGTDIEARHNMLLASFYAGDSFTRAGLTYGHPIAHTLGGLYNETHGRANAILLPVVLEAFGSCIHKKLAHLARVAGLDLSGKTESEAAQAFIQEIRRLNHSMGIPEKFDSIRREDIHQMVKWALDEANPWYPVPKIFGEKEIIAIIERIIA